MEYMPGLIHCGNRVAVAAGGETEGATRDLLSLTSVAHGLSKTKSCSKQSYHSHAAAAAAAAVRYV